MFIIGRKRRTKKEKIIRGVKKDET